MDCIHEGEVLQWFAYLRRSPATAQSNGGKFINSLTPFTAQAYGLIAYLIGIADGELTISGSYILVARAERAYHL